MTLKVLGRTAMLFAAAALTLGAAAQTPEAQSSAKIVTINFNAAVLQTAEAQKALAALQTQLTPRQTALRTLNTEVQNLQKDLQANASTLSEADRASRERTLGEKQRQLQRDADDLKADGQSESQQVYQRVAQKLYTFLQGYGAQHGYSFIVERGSDAAPVVWYAAAQLDITKDVVKAFDAQAGAGAGSAAAPAAAKPTAAKPATTPH